MEQAVCICGAGTMGRGIALALAMNKIPTRLYDLNAAMIPVARTQIEKELRNSVEKKKISSGESETTLNHISFTTSLQDCRAELIIEAVIENKETKAALFVSLEKINSSETIFATNTSSLSVTAIAELTSFPERIIGLHFFNPANRMKLVEVIQTKYNPDGMAGRLMDFLSAIGKTAVICRDAPGFIVNHVARPFYIESLRIAEQGHCDFETIDRLMESAGFKMGPFHLMDLIGNDINYAVSCSVYDALGNPERLRPSYLQESMVKKAALGRKSGKGFFEYTKLAAE